MSLIVCAIAVFSSTNGILRAGPILLAETRVSQKRSKNAITIHFDLVPNRCNNPLLAGFIEFFLLIDLSAINNALPNQGCH
jgi:hypothetical protein